MGRTDWAVKQVALIPIIVIATTLGAFAAPRPLNFLTTTILNVQQQGYGDTEFYATVFRDLNGDKFPDLFVPRWRFGGTVIECDAASDYCYEVEVNIPIVSVYLSDSSGSRVETLEFNLSYSWPYSALAYAIGDVNDDEAIDFVLGFGEELGVFHNDGTGVFDESRLVVGDQVREILLRRSNAAGPMDIIVQTDGGYKVFRGIGDGSYLPPMRVNLREDRVVTIQDINGDGIEDWVNGGSNGFEIRVGREDGSFAPPEPIIGGGFDGLVVEDFTGDGAADLLYAEVGGAYLYLARNLGNGTFALPQVYPERVRPTPKHHGDFDGDGARDLLVPYAQSDTFALYRGTANGLELVGEPIDSIQLSNRVEVVDLNGDGADEIVGYGAPTYYIDIYSYEPDAGFSRSTRLGGHIAASKLAFPDLDGNGYRDLVVTSSSTVSSFVVWYADPQGRYIDADRVTPIDTNLNHGYPLAVGDANKDGLDDVFLLMNNPSEVQVRQSTGDGYFTEALVFPNDSDGYGDLRLGDFDGDGNLDFLTTRRTLNQLTIRLGFGDGNFGPARVYPVGFAATRVDTFDANGDGRSDYFVDTETDHVRYLLLSDPTGAPMEAISVIQERSTKVLGLEDMNNDGIVDVATFVSSGFVEILLGDGLGAFAPAPRIPLDFSVNHHAIIDLNDDGFKDVLLRGRSQSTGFTVHRALMNTGTGDFTLFARKVARTGLIYRDLNQDGYVDLLGYSNSIPHFKAPGVVTLDETGNEVGPEFTLNYKLINSPIMVVGDFNGDGLQDVVSESSTHALTVSLQLPPGAASPERTRHSADVNADNMISLTEVLRVVQLYHFGDYGCAEVPTSSEDGYVSSDTAARDCVPHSIDYAPQDWRISLSELLRMLQLFSSGGYTYCADSAVSTEDGYCLGAANE